MAVPRILIPTCRHIRKDKYVQFVGEYHLDALLEMGCVPAMVPSVARIQPHLELFLETAAGLLLVEGEDIHPDRYDPPAETRAWIKSEDLVRDTVEFALIEAALERDMPILGICRGSQLINIACGGTIYTDLIKGRAGSIPHINYDNYDGYRHDVEFVPDSWLASLYETPRLRVNSYHHQGVDVLAERFRPAAYAEDGLLEAFYDPGQSFIVGLQFHPERALHEHAGHYEVFRHFATAAHAFASQPVSTADPS